MMVERLKHEGTLHSSSDLLKICVKMGGPSGQCRFSGRLVTHRLGLVPSFSCSFEDLAYIIFSYLQSRCGREGGC